MAVDKYIKQTAGEMEEKAFIVTSAGVGDAGKGVGLDATGKLDATVMPSGIGAATIVAPASENLAIGDFINLFDDAGTIKARKANATNNTKPAHGFVKVAVTSGSNATVYVEGYNNVLVGLTVGSKYFLSTTGGQAVTVAPSTTGNILQFLGYAVSTTTVNFEQRETIKLA